MVPVFHHHFDASFIGKGVSRVPMAISWQSGEVMMEDKDCHMILGRIAAKNSDMDTANANFQKASDVAHEARCYYLGLLAGKECNNAGGTGGDEMINKACSAMKKSKEAF